MSPLTWSTAVRYKTLTYAFSTLLGFTSATTADDSVFSTTNIQYLYGTDYNPIFESSKERSILTLEHFNVWEYGDTFFFIDVTNPERKDDTGSRASFYGELSPRLSFGKIFAGKELSYGPIKDVLLSTTLEMPESPVSQTLLYGIGVDLNLPGFNFFQTNLYARDNQTSALGDGQQATLVWGLPFSLGDVQLMFTGFFDYAWSQEGLEDNIVSAPQLLVDVGSLFGTPSSVQVGIEYQIWRNQFGIDGEDETALQAVIKWTMH